MKRLEEKVKKYFLQKCKEKGYKNCEISNIRIINEGNEELPCDIYALADVKYTWFLNAWDKKAEHKDVVFTFKNNHFGCQTLFGFEPKQEVWQIVHDCDLDDGTPTEWSLRVDTIKWYWIDALDDGSFDVIDSNCRTVLKNCKSLPSAKAWVTKNLL